MDSSDSDSCTESDSTSLPCAPHGADDASDSYDEWGQAKWGGVGQGAPLDENGRYIYSQAGMPAVLSPPLRSSLLPSPPWVVPTSEDMLPARENSSHDESHVDGTITRGSDAVHKRKRSDEDIETPHRHFGALLTNISQARASSVPIQPPRPVKRRRLQSPFDISMPEYYLEGAMKELQRDMKAALCKQTEILSAILEEVQGRNSKP